MDTHTIEGSTSYISKIVKLVAIVIKFFKYLYFFMVWSLNQFFFQDNCNQTSSITTGIQLVLKLVSESKLTSIEDVQKKVSLLYMMLLNVFRKSLCVLRAISLMAETVTWESTFCL